MEIVMKGKITNIKDFCKKQMQTAIDHLKQELNNIRTGRANPSLLDAVFVEVYGSKMRLKDIATVTSPEQRQLLVNAFDRSHNTPISKAIEMSDLGLTCAVDSGGIRITIPPMDKERRQQMAKLVHKLKEECKISVRNVRRECNDEIKKQKTDGDIADDMAKGLEKSIQESTDLFCKQADEIAIAKEKEVMAI